MFHLTSGSESSTAGEVDGRDDAEPTPSSPASPTRPLDRGAEPPRRGLKRRAGQKRAARSRREAPGPYRPGSAMRRCISAITPSGMIPAKATCTLFMNPLATSPRPACMAS